MQHAESIKRRKLGMSWTQKRPQQTKGTRPISNTMKNSKHSNSSVNDGKIDRLSSARKQWSKNNAKRQVNQRNPDISSSSPVITTTRIKFKNVPVSTVQYVKMAFSGETRLNRPHVYGFAVLSVKNSLRGNLEISYGPLGYFLRGQQIRNQPRGGYKLLYTIRQIFNWRGIPTILLCETAILLYVVWNISTVFRDHHYRAN